MQVILEATEGPGSGAILAIHSGQMVKIGRTAWADYSVPDDEAMADVHFAVKCDSQGCYVRDLTNGGGTLINGAKVGVSPLRSGDEITAGKTVFLVRVEGQSEPGVADAPQESIDVSPSPEAVSPTTAADFCQLVDLNDEARAMLKEDLSPAEFFELLVTEQLSSDALLFLACWVPKSDAVRWGCDCLAELAGDSLKATDAAALEAAQQWAEDPSEKHCRAAEAAANDSEFEGPASWLALGAFWSGRSLASPDLPDVPPGEGLTAQAVAAALTMAATQDDPAEAEGRYTQFLKKGRAVAEAVMSTPGQA